MSPVTATITPPPAVIVTATSPTSLRVAVTPVAPVRVTVGPATIIGGGATGIQVIAGLTVVSGQPAYVSRTDGRLYPANASAYLSGFVVGLVTAGAPTGFQAEVRRGPITLSDWTVATGTAALLPGQEYYLSPSGLMTTVPPVRPLAAVLVRIGTATSSTTLDVNPSPPILL